VQPQTTSRLDVRLAPAALTAWAATAAGIAWRIGPLIAVICAAAGPGWWLIWTRLGAGRPALRAAGISVLGVAVVGTGFGLAIALRSQAVDRHPVRQLFGQTVWVTVMPEDSPRPVGSGRLMFRAALARVADRDVTGQVVVFASGVDFGRLTAGQPARFRARISRPTRRDLTVAAITASGRPVFGEASAVQRAAQAVRTRFAAAARETLPPGQAAMLPGLVLGDTTTVTATTIAEFRTAGLTHLTAVSGANVTIVCGAVLLSARLIGPRPAVVLAALALGVFVIVVQPTASVLRAAVMGAIGLVAVLSARRRQGIPVLAAAVISLLAFAPHLAVNIGFALSVSATAALIVVAPIWSARLVARGCPKLLADAVAIALAAQLVTAPLVAAISGRLSLVAVIANLVVAPVIPPITVLGTAAAALCVLWPAAGELLIRFTGPELWWLLHCAHTAAALPGAAVAVPSGWPGIAAVGCAAVGAVVLWRRRWFRLGMAGAVVCALAWSVSGVVGGS
jgi:competence protein ComEC